MVDGVTPTSCIAKFIVPSPLIDDVLDNGMTLIVDNRPKIRARAVGIASLITRIS